VKVRRMRVLLGSELYRRLDKGRNCRTSRRNNKWADRDRSRNNCDGDLGGGRGSNSRFWEVCHTSNDNGAISAWDVGVDIWTIGRVPNLRLEVLRDRHCATAV
jgi:hypothetical protein